MTGKEIQKEYLDYKQSIMLSNQAILENNIKRISSGRFAMFKLNNILSYEEYEKLYIKSMQH